MAAKDLVSIHHLSYDLTVDYLRRITDLGDAFELRDMPRPGVLDGLEKLASSLMTADDHNGPGGGGGGSALLPSSSSVSCNRRSLFNVPGQHTKKALVRSVYSESLSILPKPSKTSASRPNSAAAALKSTTPILALTSDRAPVKPLTISQASGCGSSALIYYYFCCCFQGTISPGGIFPSLVENGDWLVTRSFVALIPRNENTKARVIAAKGGGTTTIPHPMNYIRFVDLEAISDLRKLRDEWLTEHNWVVCGSHQKAAALTTLSDWPILPLPSWNEFELKLAAFWCHPRLAKREIKTLETRAQLQGLNLKELFAPLSGDDGVGRAADGIQPAEQLNDFSTRLSYFISFSLTMAEGYDGPPAAGPVLRSKLKITPSWQSREFGHLGKKWLQQINATESDLWDHLMNSSRPSSRAEAGQELAPPTSAAAADEDVTSASVMAEKGSPKQSAGLSVSLEEAVSDVEEPPALKESSIGSEGIQDENDTSSEEMISEVQPAIESEAVDDPLVEVEGSAPDCLTSNVISEDPRPLIGETLVCQLGRMTVSNDPMGGAPSPPPLQQSPILNHVRPQTTTLTPIAEERSEISNPTLGDGAELTPKFSSRVSAAGLTEELVIRNTTPSALQNFDTSVKLPPSKTSVTAIEALPALGPDEEVRGEGLALTNDDLVAALGDLPVEDQKNTCLVLSRPGSPSRMSSPRSYSCAVIIDSDYDIGPAIQHPLLDERKTPARLSIDRQQPCEIMMDETGGPGRSIVQSMVKCWEMSMSPDASMAPSGARQSAIRARVEQKKRAAVRDSVRRRIRYEDLGTDVINEQLPLQDDEDECLHQICLAPVQSKKRRYSEDTSHSLLCYPHSAPLLMSDTIIDDPINPALDCTVEVEDVDTLERDIQLLKHQMNMAARQWRMCEAALGTMTSRLQEQKALKGSR